MSVHKRALRRLYALFASVLPPPPLLVFFRGGTTERACLFLPRCVKAQSRRRTRGQQAAMTTTTTQPRIISSRLSGRGNCEPSPLLLSLSPFAKPTQLAPGWILPKTHAATAKTRTRLWRTDGSSSTCLPPPPKARRKTGLGG